MGEVATRVNAVVKAAGVPQIRGPRTSPAAMPEARAMLCGTLVTPPVHRAMTNPQFVVQDAHRAPARSRRPYSARKQQMLDLAERVAADRENWITRHRFYFEEDWRY